LRLRGIEDLFCTTLGAGDTVATFGAAAAVLARNHAAGGSRIFHSRDDDAYPFYAGLPGAATAVLWLEAKTLVEGGTPCRAPVTLSGLHGQQLLFRPGVMLQAAAAHFTAEALMNIPRMLGSLELLLNPTGLLTSVSAGLEDLLGLPFAALTEASPAQVLHGSFIVSINSSFQACSDFMPFDLERLQHSTNKHYMYRISEVIMNSILSILCILDRL